MLVQGTRGGENCWNRTSGLLHTVLLQVYVCTHYRANVCNRDGFSGALSTVLSSLNQVLRGSIPPMVAYLSLLLSCGGFRPIRLLSLSAIRLTDRRSSLSSQLWRKIPRIAVPMIGISESHHISLSSFLTESRFRGISRAVREFRQA